MMVDLMNIYVVNTKLLPQLCNEDDDNELIFSITLWTLYMINNERAVALMLPADKSLKTQNAYDIPEIFFA